MSKTVISAEMIKNTVKPHLSLYIYMNNISVDEYCRMNVVNRTSVSNSKRNIACAQLPDLFLLFIMGVGRGDGAIL